MQRYAFLGPSGTFTEEALFSLGLGDIHHALITAPGVLLKDVTEVLSHPHATAQCNNWLKSTLQGIPITATNSTAEAVKDAVANPGIAAVGNKFAASLHGGEIHQDFIEDYPKNKTRFVVVGKAPAPKSNSNKTTLALFLHQDKPGTLLMILSEFAYCGINLLQIQSRPTKLILGQYMFFVDFEGHIEDPNVALALSCLRLKLREVKILGSFPRYGSIQIVS